MTEDTVWSQRVRFFHWFNAFLVLSMIAMGIMLSGAYEYFGFVFDKEFIESIIPYHIGTGVILAINFIYRVSYLFNTKDEGESISEINPLSKTNITQLKDMAGQESGHAYKYHNPIGRLMIFGWFLILSLQIVTGAILSYEHLTESGGMEISMINNAYAHGSSHNEDVSESIVKTVEPDSFIMTIHELSMYLIIFMLFAHVGGVVKESIRIKKNLVMKMIKGS